MNEQRAREGVEHLQAAALEVIAAVRAFLDIAEDVVRDPAAATAMVQNFAEAGRAPAAHMAPAARGTTDATDGDRPAEGVTRIRVS